MIKTVPVCPGCSAQDAYDKVQAVKVQIESDTLDLDDVIALVSLVKTFLEDNHEVE